MKGNNKGSEFFIGSFHASMKNNKKMLETRSLFCLDELMNRNAYSISEVEKESAESWCLIVENKLLWCS
jgi:hypothetical protein